MEETAASEAASEEEQAAAGDVEGPEARPSGGTWRGRLRPRQMVAPTVAWLLVSVGLSLLSGGAPRAQLQRRRAALPRPFFAPGSAVVDLYGGNGAAPRQLLSQAELVLCMYYAPWSARSQDARWHFDQASKHFPSSQALFVAVNCWAPTGQCKQSYKMYSYPVILAYLISSSKPILYNGFMSADYLHRFVEALLNPLARLSSAAEAYAFIDSLDASVLSYFDFANSSARMYRNFYATALRALERDPSQAAVQFGVLSNRSLATEVFGLSEGASLALYQTTDESLSFYQTSKPFISRLILEWVAENLDDSILSWFPSHGSPIGSKDDELLTALAEQPTLLLITPRRPLFESGGAAWSRAFATVRAVALEYADCQAHNGTRRASSARRAIDGRLAAARRLGRLRSECARCDTEQRRAQSLQLQSVSVAPHHNVCAVCPAATHLSAACDRQCDDGGRRQCAAAAAAASGRHPRFALRYVDRSCRPTNACAKLRLAKLLSYGSDNHHSASQSEEPPYQNQNFLGLGCASQYRNRTLQFLALDAAHYQWFSRKLGLSLVTVGESAPETAVYVVDNGTETVFALPQSAVDGSFGATLRAFIQDFAANRLSPHRRTSLRPREEEAKSGAESSGIVRLTRLTAANFESVALNGSSDVLVLFSASWCGACQGVLHVMHTVAAYLRVVSDRLVFAVIDASQNDLPWQYTVDRYPTLVLFPARRTADSHVFPQDLALNVPNALAFVLARCSAETRWRVALAFCRRDCLRRQRRRALRLVHAARARLLRLRAATRHRTAPLELQWLRRQIRHKELQRRVGRAFLQLLHSLDHGADVFNAREETKSALFLQWILQNRLSGQP